MKRHFNAAYLFAVLVAGFQVAMEFGLPVSESQSLAVTAFLAVVFGVNTAYNDPRVPLGRGNGGDVD